MEWWTAKIAGNKERDAEVRAALADAGWSVIVVWECETEVAAKVGEVARVIKEAPRLG